jgi:hypothetical protein
MSALPAGTPRSARYQEALRYAKLALTQAPDDSNRAILKGGIAKLEQGKDMNQ